MLLTADWIVPIDSAPIREGGVIVKGGSIAEIGRAETLASRDYRGPRHDFPGCVIMPGLVNAHTHLAMTALKGVLDPMPFHEWITRIPSAFRALSEDDIAASIAYGAHRAISSGTTVVGDIAYGPESLAICADTGLAGRFFWEVLGIPAEGLAQHLYDMEFPTDPERKCSERFRCGLSPHAPYTSGPELIQAVYKIARAQGIEFAIHVAESPAETELTRTGRGPLARLANRLAHGFVVPGSSPVSYLGSLGVLDDAVLIHAVRTLPTDMPKLSRRGARVVLCPRSNEFLHNGIAPVWRLQRAGIPVAIGTDSLASAPNLDLFDEARALHAIEPRLDARRLVEIMTRGGAEVLGMADKFGSLTPGYQADIAVYRIPHASDPFEALLDHGGRKSIEAVLSAGVWRVLEGSPLMSISVIERSAQIAGQRAKLALALNTPEV